MPSRKAPKAATELSVKDPADQADDSPLVPKPCPEVVIGLVGPVGIDLDPIVDVLARRLEAVAYRALPVRLSPSLSFGTTTPNEIIDLGRYGGVYGTTFV